jgi:hypothetical protein
MKSHQFEEVPINIPDDLVVPLFQVFASKFLHPASSSFMEGLSKKNLKKKLFKAIQNEIILMALSEVIDEFESSKKASQGEVEESQETLLGQQSQRSCPFGYTY